MTTIYRIQDKEGRGPWRPGFSSKWTIERSDWKDLVPFQMQFGNVHQLRTPGMTMGCGCMTIDQLKRWFIPKEYETLLSFGYQSVSMEANTIVAQSDIQCVFERFRPFYMDAHPFDLYKTVDNSTRF